MAAGAVVAVAGLAAAAGATGAGWAGALAPMLAGRTDLLLPMRLAWASEGKVSEAIAMAITEAVARYEVFTEYFPIMVVISGRLHPDEHRRPRTSLMRLCINVFLLCN